MKTNQYVLVSKILFLKTNCGLLLGCLDNSKSQKLLQEFYGVCGGLFEPAVTENRIIRASYYWPTMFRDAYAMIIKFLSFQKFYGKMKRESMPLKPILAKVHFLQWGVYALFQSTKNPVKDMHTISLLSIISQSGKKQYI